MTSSTPSGAPSGSLRTITTRCGVTVTGGAEGAGAEKCTPVRSIRVDGPGTGRSSISSVNRAATICI